MIIILIVLLCFSANLNFANSISGTVKDKTTDIPLSQVLITLSDSEFNKIDSTFSDLSGNWEIEYEATGISDESLSPESFQLYQNYPNPFNPSTKISLKITNAGNVEIIISDILGQTLDRKTGFLSPGTYSIEWNGSTSAGVYFYTVIHNNKSFTRKMIQLDGHGAGGLSSFRSVSFSNSENLKKTKSGEYHLVLSRFGFVNDTIKVDPAYVKHIDSELETVHSKAILFDLHNDVLEKMLVDPEYHLGDYHLYPISNIPYHTDIPRLKKGGVDAQLFVVWVDPQGYDNYYETANEMIDIFNSEIQTNSSEIQQTYDLSTSLSAINENKIAAVLVVEGGHVIENSIAKLKDFYDAGMRYLTITWNNSTDWAVSAQDSRSETEGLSEFGRDVIRTMDSLGVIIDVSHTGIKTIEDILEITKNPIIASHSGVRALRDHYRNLRDDQIIAIANSGGVIGVVFYPPFLGYLYNEVDIESVIEHIDYIVNLAGIDYVALGSDFDGIGTNTVNGLEDVTKFPMLTIKLLEHGYTPEEVEKILGGNFMRVFEQVCGN